LTIAVEMGVIACALIVTAVLTTYFAPESAPEPMTPAQTQAS